MRVHYSCLRLPTPPLPPHVHPHHSVTPSGWFCGRFYSFFVVYGVFFLFLFAKLHKYNDTLATSVAQCRCHHPPVLRSVRLGFGKSWIRSLVLLKSTMWCVPVFGYVCILYVNGKRCVHTACLGWYFVRISLVYGYSGGYVFYSYSSYNKSQQDALFLNFILIYNSTCFGETYCPSPGVLILYSQQLVFVILVMLTVS